MTHSSVVATYFGEDATTCLHKEATTCLGIGTDDKVISKVSDSTTVGRPQVNWGCIVTNRQWDFFCATKKRLHLLPSASFYQFMCTEPSHVSERAISALAKAPPQPVPGRKCQRRAQGEARFRAYRRREILHFSVQRSSLQAA